MREPSLFVDESGNSGNDAKYCRSKSLQMIYDSLAQKYFA